MCICVCASMCVCVLSFIGGGGWIHTSLFVLFVDTNGVALPFLIRGPHSISAMPAQDWRSELIFQ